MIHYTRHESMVIDISLKRDQQSLLQETKWHYALGIPNWVVVQKERPLKQLKHFETMIMNKRFQIASKNHANNMPVFIIRTIDLSPRLS